MPSPRSFFGSNAILLLSRCSRQLECIRSRRSFHPAPSLADLGAQPLAAGVSSVWSCRRQPKVAAMETQLNGLRIGGPEVLDLEKNPTVEGGVGDTFGEDAATESQTLTPWSRQVASGLELLRDPRYNKGLAFSEEERDRHYLSGLLPAAVISQGLQVQLILQNVRSYVNPIEKYVTLTDLKGFNLIVSTSTVT